MNTMHKMNNGVKVNASCQKTAVRSYEQYVAMLKNPAEAMSKQEYEKKYLNEAKGTSSTQAPSRTGIPSSIGGDKSDPALGIDKKPQKSQRPAEKVFPALINMARKPELKGKMTGESAQKILNNEGHKLSDFINHLFDGVKKNTVNFDDITNFEDLGIITPDYTKRRLKINDMEGMVPPKHYNRYDIKHVDNYKSKSSSKIRLAVSILELLSKNSKG